MFFSPSDCTPELHLTFDSDFSDMSGKSTVAVNRVSLRNNSAIFNGTACVAVQWGLYREPTDAEDEVQTHALLSAKATSGRQLQEKYHDVIRSND